MTYVRPHRQKVCTGCGCEFLDKRGSNRCYHCAYVRLRDAKPGYYAELSRRQRAEGRTPSWTEYMAGDPARVERRRLLEKSPARRAKAKVYNKAYRASASAKVAAYNRVYRAAHPEIYALSAAKTRQKWPEQARKASEQRAKRIALVDDRPNLSLVMRRDGLWCYLCQSEVDPTALSLDHIVPLSRRGRHSEKNLKVTHRLCNRRKYNSLLSELPWYVGLLYEGEAS